MDSLLAKLQQAVTAAVAGKTEEQLTWHRPGKWCAAEVLEHLYLSYTGTTKGMERVLAEGKPLASKPSLKNRVQAFAVTGLRYFPEGRKSPKTAEPRGLPAEKVRSEIADAIAAMDEAIARCESKFGGVKLLDHPVLGPLNAPQWRRFHLVHGLHHEKQLRRLCDSVTGDERPA